MDPLPPDDWDDTPEWDEGNTTPLDASGRLQVARAVLGLSQQGAADLLSIPVATLRNWEQRRTDPDDAAKTLIRLFYHHPHQIAALLSGNAA